MTRVHARQLRGRHIRVNAVAAPPGNPVEPTDIALVVAFLVNGEGRSLNGQIIRVDGSTGRRTRTKPAVGGPSSGGGVPTTGSTWAPHDVASPGGRAVTRTGSTAPRCWQVGTMVIAPAGAGPAWDPDPPLSPR